MQRLTVCVASLCLPMLLYRLNATTSLVSRMDWMLEGNWKLPGYETLRSVCQLHTNNDKLKTKSDRQSNAQGQPQRTKQVKQVHSTPPSNPPICVYVKIHFALFVLTDQELIQSSLTCCRKKLSAQCASLRQISPCLMDFLSP